MRSLLAVALTLLAVGLVFLVEVQAEFTPSEQRLALTFRSDIRPATPLFTPIQYPACPDNGYASSRSGFGSCGQFCRTTRGEQFNCPSSTRPVYLRNGGCTCCPFPECR